MVDFEFQRVDKEDPRMWELFQLRYQVYCLECGFESPDAHPGGIEFDEYDEHASHFCAMVAETKKIIGTVRIILPSPFGLPIERHCQFYPDRPMVDFARVGEISRLAISKDFRRREIDRALYAQKDVNLIEVRRLHDQRRMFEGLIVAGLYQCVYQESRVRGLTHWYAVMVRGLCSLLRRWGLVWVPIGPEVEYHGRRIPYLAIIDENERQASILNPQLLKKPTGWSD